MHREILSLKWNPLSTMSLLHLPSMLAEHYATLVVGNRASRTIHLIWKKPTPWVSARAKETTQWPCWHDKEGTGWVENLHLFRCYWIPPPINPHQHGQGWGELVQQHIWRTTGPFNPGAEVSPDLMVLHDWDPTRDGGMLCFQNEATWLYKPLSKSVGIITMGGQDSNKGVNRSMSQGVYGITLSSRAWNYILATMCIHSPVDLLGLWRCGTLERGSKNSGAGARLDFSNPYMYHVLRFQGPTFTRMINSTAASFVIQYKRIIMIHDVEIHKE